MDRPHQNEEGAFRQERSYNSLSINLAREARLNYCDGLAPGGMQRGSGLKPGGGGSPGLKPGGGSHPGGGLKPDGGLGGSSCAMASPTIAPMKPVIMTAPTKRNAFRRFDIAINTSSVEGALGVIA
ncbi:hypothetical protein CCR94_03475 [Rhodoblastus sphagnicola]|uniref:Uncharacterized protein n=1 Tax=Rhodoblastus sphagnicola TaxID=333368 RepID=A0A2S6NE88_9HYPH|nr:hypothetical protein CCR94_03475 [Rhodoblastus sphagnicola]